MIVYANGCSHTAAAEAVVPDCFAVDNGRHGIDRRPHPVNLAASWCTHVATALQADLVCEAESGGSNARTLRTTRDWIAQNHNQLQDTLLIIQWTTWERQEWLHQGRWYQVNASGRDWIPQSLKKRYSEYIASIDWHTATQQAHQDIWQFKLELDAKNIQYLFFSGHSTFSDISDQKNWGHTYMHPYLREGSYHNWLINNGGTYANPKSYHFDAKSHRLWANYVLQYLYRNQIVDPNREISTD